MNLYNYYIHSRFKSVYSKIIFLVYFSALSIALYGQNDTIRYETGITTVASTGKYTPFWLQSNQYGEISASPTSALIFAGLEKGFYNPQKLFDYSFKADVFVSTDKNKKEIYLHEIFSKARFSVFNIMIGSREQIFGNQDSTLSSGGLLFSKNSF